MSEGYSCLGVQLTYDLSTEPVRPWSIHDHKTIYLHF